MTHAPRALLAGQQVEHRAAEQQRVRAAGREVRRRPFAQPPGDRRPHVPRLAAQPLRRALHEPRPAPPAGQPERRGGRRQRRVPGGHVAAGQQRRRRQHQHLQRALDVRRPVGQQPGGEHVQLAPARPADDVAARRRRRQAAEDRHPGLGRVELRGRGVQHHRQLARALGEALLQPQPRVLELGEHALGVSGVARVVARDEGLRSALHPRHASSSWHGVLDLDRLLERRPVDPLDQRLGRPAGRALADRVPADLVAGLAGRVAAVDEVRRDRRRLGQRLARARAGSASATRRSAWRSGP